MIERMKRRMPSMVRKTMTMVILDKKTKSKTRRALKKELRNVET